MKRLLALAVLAASITIASAAVPKVHITGTLYDAGGKPVRGGSITAILYSSSGPTSGSVQDGNSRAGVGGATTGTISAAGVVSIDLVSNATILPVGTYYQVSIKAASVPGGSPWTQQWFIPGNVTSLDIGSVDRTDIPTIAPVRSLDQDNNGRVDISDQTAGIQLCNTDGSPPQPQSCNPGSTCQTIDPYIGYNNSAIYMCSADGAGWVKAADSNVADLMVTQHPDDYDVDGTLISHNLSGRLHIYSGNDGRRSPNTGTFVMLHQGAPFGNGGNIQTSKLVLEGGGISNGPDPAPHTLSISVGSTNTIATSDNSGIAMPPIGVTGTMTATNVFATSGLTVGTGFSSAIGQFNRAAAGQPAELQLLNAGTTKWKLGMAPDDNKLTFRNSAGTSWLTLDDGAGSATVQALNVQGTQNNTSRSVFNWTDTTDANNSTVYISRSGGGAIGKALMLSLGGTYNWGTYTDGGGVQYDVRYVKWNQTNNRWESAYAGSVVGPWMVTRHYNGSMWFDFAPVQTYAVGDPLAFKTALFMRNNGGFAQVGINTQTPGATLNVVGDYLGSGYIKTTDKMYAQAIDLSRDGTTHERISNITVNGRQEQWYDLNADGTVQTDGTDYCVGYNGPDYTCDGHDGPANWIELKDEFLPRGAGAQYFASHRITGSGQFAVAGTSDADPPGGNMLGGMVWATNATINSTVSWGMAYDTTFTSAWTVPAKMLNFQTRSWFNTGTPNDHYRVFMGLLRTSDDVTPVLVKKQYALGFYCAPSDDVNGDGTAATGTDLNYWAVAMNGAVDDAAGKLASSTNTTAVNTGVACGTGLTFSMERRAGSVYFYVDFALKATISTNLPTSGVSLIGGVLENTDAVNHRFNLDMAYYRGRRY